MLKRLQLGILSLALAFLLLLNVRLHQPGGPATVHAQLRYLEGALDDGAAVEMQALFPEGFVFTWALYGLTSARVAGEMERGDARREHLLAETRRSIVAIHSDLGREPFDREMTPAYGAFYASWSLYVLAEYVRSAGPENVPPSLVAQLTREGDRFAEALAAYGSPFLESYPEQVWPADTAPGIAALGIYDAVVEPRYGAVIRRWVGEARAHMDPRRGALTHTAAPVTGRHGGDARGESLALMARLLVDADPRFAREQYAALRRHFFVDAALLPGMREYPHGVDGRADMDTGPLVLGYSGPAVVVGAAAARANGDHAVADVLLGAAEVMGLPVQLAGRRAYAFGELPVGDAFIAWARTSPVPGVGHAAWEPVSPWWGARFHAVSAVLTALLAWWAYRVVRPRIRTTRRRV